MLGQAHSGWPAKRLVCHFSSMFQRYFRCTNTLHMTVGNAIDHFFMHNYLDIPPRSHVRRTKKSKWRWTSSSYYHIVIPPWCNLEVQNILYRTIPSSIRQCLSLWFGLVCVLLTRLGRTVQRDMMNSMQSKVC
jgi:hypothetical protein